LIPKIKSPGSRQGFDFTADEDILLRIAAPASMLARTLRSSPNTVITIASQFGRWRAAGSCAIASRPVPSACTSVVCALPEIASAKRCRVA